MALLKQKMRYRGVFSKYLCKKEIVIAESLNERCGDMIRYIEAIENNVNIGNYYNYWNNVEYEKEKVFNVHSIDECEKIIQYEKDDGIYFDLEYLASKYLSKSDRGISLASGVCWEGGLLFNEIGLKRMDFLDFSKHRIFGLAPIMLKFFDVSDDLDIKLIHADYYHVPSNNHNYDFVLLSEALMMAEYPKDLLLEVARILKADGICMIIGEPKTTEIFVKQQMEKISSRRGAGKSISVFEQRESLAFDISGANWYEYCTYEKMFCSTGFEVMESGGNDGKFWWFLLKRMEKI